MKNAPKNIHPLRIAYTHAHARLYIMQKITKICHKAIEDGYSHIIFLCVGTDRMTGDALGPVTGEKIRSFIRGNFFVYGTLELPIHAKNVEKKMNDIYNTFSRPYIIVLDACFGEVSQIGDIVMGEGGICIGRITQKKGIQVGNAYILGVVDGGGGNLIDRLYNTRLFYVMRLSNILAEGIQCSIEKQIRKRKFTLTEKF